MHSTSHAAAVHPATTAVHAASSTSATSATSSCGEGGRCNCQRERQGCRPQDTKLRHGYSSIIQHTGQNLSIDPSFRYFAVISNL
jgi:hypothetical protein